MPVSNYPGTLPATQWAGSAIPATSAARVTTGTMTLARMPTFALGPQPMGSVHIGSVAALAAGRGIAISSRGELWHTEDTNNYVVRFGTLALRGGTNSRMGTTKIGSFKTPNSSPRGVAFPTSGHLYLVDQGNAYIYRIGTLALRGGTNSRQGTQRVGSCKWFNAAPTESGFSPRGELWVSETTANYIHRIGTLSLRGGTNSRMGTARIGSFKGFSTSPSGNALSMAGQLWHADNNTRYVFVVGTLALRGGTNSRQGTYAVGSFTAAGSLSGVAFRPNGELWGVAGVSSRGLFERIGTRGGIRNVGILYNPGSTPRWVNVAFLANSGIGNTSGADLRQQRVGTLSHFLVAVTGVNVNVSLAAMILPHFGSYRVVATGATVPIRRYWREDGLRS